MAPWLLLMVTVGKAQITWGPQPMFLSETDDFTNQQRLYELLQQAYLTDYEARHPEHRLAKALAAELVEFQQRVPTSPSLALAVAMGKYHFAWYKEDGKVDVQSVWEAAELLMLSIQFSQCDRSELPMEVFFQRMCHVRWPYAVLLFSELGREFASRYLTEEAANTLERALATFDAMKLLPYYSQMSWQNAYDVNFNEEWSPGSANIGPVWDKSIVPLAQLLESKFPSLQNELQMLQSDPGLFDELSFEHSKVEGQASWPEGGWRAVQLRQGNGAWQSRACDVLPSTCALLSARPELSCANSGAALVRLRPGGRLKPHFGPAPQLQLHIALRADVGARMSVGNRTLSWQTGEVLVIDGSFIHQEWHNGVRGDNFVLQVTFCHPCDESQRPLYGPLQCGGRPVASPGAARSAVEYQDAATLPVPFAAAALWAVSLPDLAKCSSINEECPPDSQHGGPNPLSALNTWNYVMNNLRAAIRHTTSQTQIDPQVMTAIGQVQEGIQNFLAMPSLEQYAPVVTLASQILEALTPWLRQQAPAMLKFPSPAARLPVPADGRSPGTFAFRLSNGVEMPAIGFGTWKLEGEACYQTVLAALQLGLRHIDTAEAYQNEAEIGRAIRDSQVPREKLFIATKATSVALGMAEPSYLETIVAGQLQALRTEYLDVYMLHAAGVEGDKLQQVWRNMEYLVDLGRVRALGVSNFGIQELERLWAIARVKPVYLQNIFKIYKQGEQILGNSQSVMDWARSHGMMMVGYSTINSWPHLLQPLSDPHVLQIAKAKGRTASQVLHRWALQHGIGVIPKASSIERIRENSQLLDFELSDAQMSALDGLATLSETTHNKMLPSWREDVFGLAAATSTPGPRFDGFVEAMRDQECIRQPEEVKATQWTLGGGGHGISECQAACHAQADCGYLVFYEQTGFCHMFRSCQQQLPAGDGAVLLARQ